MKKILLFILATIILTPFANAQKCAKIDSLNRAWRLVKDKDIKAEINTLNALVYEYSRDHQGKASFLAKQALEMAQEEKYDKGIADALMNNGFIEYQELHHAKTAIADYQKALKIYKDLQDDKSIVKALEAIADFYYRLADETSYKNALNTYQQVLDYKRRAKDIAGISRVSEKLGELYSHLGQYKKGEEILQKAMEHEDFLGENSNTARLLLGLYAHIDQLQNKAEGETSKNNTSLYIIMGLSALAVVLLGALVYLMMQRNKTQAMIAASQEQDVEPVS
jgi:tetratricopeptide (TPR) repeat protein